MFKDQETIDSIDLDIDYNGIEPLYLPQPVYRAEEACKDSS